jgi:hypothetical protein
MVYSIIIGTSLPQQALFVLSVLGLALGTFQGRKTQVWSEHGRARAQNTIWFLVIWALSYSMTQLLIILGRSLSLNIGIGTMCFSTGIALGSQGNILFRLLKTKRILQPISVSPSQSPPSRAGKILSAPVPFEEKYCRQCGAPLLKGDLFCRQCRASVQKRS